MYKMYVQGALESVNVGEIRLCLRLNRGPKLHLLICDVRVVTSSSNKSQGKPKRKKSSSSSSSRPKKNKGKKIMAVANFARYLSISVRNIVVKVRTSMFFFFSPCFSFYFFLFCEDNLYSTIGHLLAMAVK